MSLNLLSKPNHQRKDVSWPTASVSFTLNKELILTGSLVVSDLYGLCVVKKH